MFLAISGNCTTRLLEDLLKPSDRVRRCSLVIVMPTEADWNTGPKITIAALLKKNIPTWKKNIPFSVVLGHDVVNSRELLLLNH